jgi:hypothetical protein
MATSSPPTIAGPFSSHTVTLKPFNTIHLEHDEVCHLVTAHCGSYAVNILNLGPCTVYIRADADPHVNDPDSETLPPGSADNMLHIPDGPHGLRVIAGAPCVCMVVQDIDDPDCKAEHPIIGEGATITVRLVQI